MGGEHRKRRRHDAGEVAGAQERGRDRRPDRPGVAGGGPGRQEIQKCRVEDREGKEAADFYVSIFPNSEIVNVSHYGDAGPREAGTVLSRSQAGLAAYLAALLNWHRSHRYCANCGAVTLVKEGGYARRCPRCHTTHFPRTDPVVIMTIEHDDRLLLGRRPAWPSRRYSTLAGFVAPGEAAEEAVVREVHEESGIVARDPEFVSSQPWPFPRSLMLGFAARADGGEPSARDGELADVRWFDHDELLAAANGDNPELILPPPISIARFLIDRWMAARR